MTGFLHECVADGRSIRPERGHDRRRGDRFDLSGTGTTRPSHCDRPAMRKPRQRTPHTIAGSGRPAASPVAAGQRPEPPTARASLPASAFITDGDERRPNLAWRREASPDPHGGPCRPRRPPGETPANAANRSTPGIAQSRPGRRTSRRPDRPGHHHDEMAGGPAAPCARPVPGTAYRRAPVRGRPLPLSEGYRKRRRDPCGDGETCGAQPRRAGYKTAAAVAGSTRSRIAVTATTASALS